MKCQTYTDRLRRIAIANNEPLRDSLRFLRKCPDVPNKTRLLAQFKLGELAPVSSEFRVNRRCILSGWGRSVISEFNLSRQRFRELALKGKLLGITKSSW
jgi:small subunit ribosomal protein S14